MPFLIMGIGLHNLIKDFKPGNRKSTMNILAMVFFVFLSTFFWFFITISKTYIETVSFPVTYKNFPSKRVQVGDLPKNLRITVETDGIKILRYRIWTAIDPLNIDVDQSTIFPLSRRDSLKFYILTNLERKQISDQLTSEIRILNISPDTILFNFDYMRTKKVPIIARIQINCKPQYMKVGEPYLDPDSIILNGPSSILDTLKAIYTSPFLLNNAKEPINKNILLENIKGLDTGKRKVKLIADIDKYTQSKVEVPVFAINVPDSLKIKTFPGKITISYHVPFKIFENIKPEDFLMTVDYNNIGVWSKEKLKVSLDQRPENINVLGWEPKNVEFIIER